MEFNCGTFIYHVWVLFGGSSYVLLHTDMLYTCGISEFILSKGILCNQNEGTPTQFLMLQLHAVRKWQGSLFFVTTLTAQFLCIYCHSVAVTVNVICWAEGSKHMVLVSKEGDYPVVSANLSVDHEFPDSMAI